jgi:hypothetical protein
MTRQLISIEIPLLGGASIRIQSVTERRSAPSNPPPSRPSIATTGVTVSDGPGLARAVVARLVPFAIRKSA